MESSLEEIYATYVNVNGHNIIWQEIGTNRLSYYVNDLLMCSVTLRR